MKALKIILSIIAAVIIILLVFLWGSGFFNSVKVEERMEGGYKVVGMEFLGPYSKAGKFMGEVEKKLNNDGITGNRGFGIYYDDPKTTPAEKCRSFVGSILEEKDFARISELQSKGYKVDSIAESNAVVAEFPIKSNMSYMIGPMKVYPVISKYVREKGYITTLSLEIYDMKNKRIIYIMQCKK